MHLRMNSCSELLVSLDRQTFVWISPSVETAPGRTIHLPMSVAKHHLVRLSADNSLQSALGRQCHNPPVEEMALAQVSVPHTCIGITPALHQLSILACIL